LDNFELIARRLGLVVLALPGLTVALLGLPALFNRPLSERATSRFVQAANVGGLAAALGVLALMLAGGLRHISIELGNVVSIPHYHFSIKFVFDRLSVPFVILTFLLCGTIAAFATKYMHRESGFGRFFLFYALFVLGMITATLADTIETLFTGWELVGLSSAMLVAFFHERPSPVRNGLRVWSVYRVSDAALLAAAVVMHHMAGEGDFEVLLGRSSWPDGNSPLAGGEAFAVGLLLLAAAAGKSALVPFSGWLPRAMEGPTPSSAVFYGALSVHLGAFLLLRASPILDNSPWLCGLVVILGLLTAAFSALVGRVQTDIKSALSYASLTQVGLIVAEIGFGLRYIALVHILGHACLRALQFLRAPTLLHDYHQLESAIGEHLPRLAGAWDKLLHPSVAGFLYQMALERGSFDAILSRFVAEPVLGVFRRCDALERRWTSLLAGPGGDASGEPRRRTTALEEL
jgi:NAD(P)H-quinone oxidoreductase subunit 5